ncbi:enoyl-CoA hydratase/isomerase family protein [Celeribacter neptunius]|uniref:3-hydroxyisobutyryl-CoA hydrolase n=1 Tax=Celeribacter neptunius TaxID=588602 RepID=A0A1I3JJB6_9RHOB|nr:enoyl-CoA hydratase/isomerase family protein [Celeribacter neptunius]SFI60078.1 Enoyl-CoA hydratase/carnithine racemase [Celeribacter neptunius]
MTELILRKQGVAGRITLNRPEALNALTPGMCKGIRDALALWRDDPEVHCLVIDGAGPRAFCAGGDIAEVYAHGTRGDASFAQNFWRDEYHLNLALAEFPKPVVALMHGFTLGGGVGIGGHAHKRVVCETSQIGLPECTIGLVTDVGGTLLLARAPGRLGDFLALTAWRMGPFEAISAGFADRYVPQDLWEPMLTRLCESGNLCVIDAFAKPFTRPELLDAVEALSPALAQDSLAELRTALSEAPGELAAKALRLIDKNDPLAMAASRRLIAEARQHDSLREALAGEFRYTARAIGQSDFLEGIRARVIDKDGAPNWSHRIEEVETVAASLLDPLGEMELWVQSPQ